MDRRSLIKLSVIGAVALTAGLTLALSGQPQKVAAQGASTCVECHSTETPGIVEQWQQSVMSKNGVDCATPEFRCRSPRLVSGAAKQRVDSVRVMVRMVSCQK